MPQHQLVTHSLAQIAKRAGVPFEVISDAADALCDAGLLKE